MRSKTRRGEGLVPRWGRGGVWQNPRCQFAAPSHNSGSSCLGVPAPAGTSHCNENMSRTTIRDVPSNQPRRRLSTGESCRVVDRWSMAESENVVRGLVPRWGRGGAWQNPRCQFAVPSHNSTFSCLGVPAPAGMSDCYESVSRTPIRGRDPGVGSPVAPELCPNHASGPPQADDFHPLMWPSQGHWRFRRKPPWYPGTKPDV